MKYKELEESILVFRFNRIIAASWNSKYIDFIRIVTREDIGMELLAVIALAAPKHFTSSAIQKEKRRVLRRIQNHSSGKFFIDNTRWRGTPFYIETGNEIPESSEGITIVYKACDFPVGEMSEPNRIFFGFSKDGRFDLYINHIDIGLSYKTPRIWSWKLVTLSKKL